MQTSSVDSSAAMVERLLDQQRAVMREQREYEEKKVAQMEDKEEKLLAKMEAKLQAKEVQMEAKLAELTPKPASEAISEEQLVALQARLEGLHVTKLLTDEVSMLSREACSRALRKTDVCLAGAVCAGRPRRGLR